jgi:hypothetical protein
MTSITASEDSYTPMAITTSVTGLTGNGLDLENLSTRAEEFTRASGSTVSSWVNENQNERFNNLD